MAVVGKAFMNFGVLKCGDKKSVLEEVERLLDEPVTIFIERRKNICMGWDCYKITYKYSSGRPK